MIDDTLPDDRASAPRAPVVVRARDQLAPGDTLDRYVILSRLGQGGMGTVYAAYDPKLDRRVALKVLRWDRANIDSHERLEREARALARLNHPNVVAVFDVGSSAGETFIAMEFVEGSDLRAWLEADRDPTDVLAKFLPAGEGLWAAHQAGLIHRDFKPANVLLGADGRVRVGDFGLVHVEGGSAPGGPPQVSPGTLSPRTYRDLTATGAVMGTPAYMSPEQSRGGDVTALADQYSYAVSLDHALAGRGSARVKAALARALSEDPAARFPTMRALLDQLYPPRPRRSRLGPALVTVLLGGFCAFLLWPTRGLAPCAAPGEEMAETWNDAARARLRAAFTRVGAAARSDRALQALDAYAARWQTGRRRACEATHVRHEQTTDLLDRRLACFDGQARQLRGVVTSWEAGIDAVGARQAPGVIAAIGGPEQCSADRVLDRPVDAVAHRPIRERLDEIRGWFYAGRNADVFAATEELAKRATVDPALHAEALVLRARSAQDGNVSEQLALASLDPAARSHHDAMTAEALLLLVETYGYLGRDDLALGLVPIARAAVLRTGKDIKPEHQADRMLMEANALRQRGEGKQAVAMLEEAIAYMRVELSEMKPRRADALSELGRAHWDVGNAEAARAALEEARALLVEVVGEGSPAVSAAENTLAEIEAAAGRHSQAVAMWKKSAARDIAAQGPTSLTLVNSYGPIAKAQLAAGNLQEAEQYFLDLLAVLAANQLAEHPVAVDAHTHLGEVHAAQGRDADARKQYDEAIRLINGAGLDGKMRAQPLIGLAELDWKAGRQADARKQATEAAAAVPDDDPDFETVRQRIAKWRAAHGD